MSYARIGSLRHSAAEDDDDCSLAQRGPAPIPKLLIPRLLGHGPRRRPGSAPGPGREQDWARNLSRQRWEAGTLFATRCPSRVRDGLYERQTRVFTQGAQSGISAC